MALRGDCLHPAREPTFRHTAVSPPRATNAPPRIASKMNCRAKRIFVGIWIFSLTKTLEGARSAANAALRVFRRAAARRNGSRPGGKAARTRVQVAHLRAQSTSQGEADAASRRLRPSAATIFSYHKTKKILRPSLNRGAQNPKALAVKPEPSSAESPRCFHYLRTTKGLPQTRQPPQINSPHPSFSTSAASFSSRTIFFEATSDAQFVLSFTTIERMRPGMPSSPAIE